MRLRVLGLKAAIGWAWTYEVYDPARRPNYQIVISGSRATWREALRDGCNELRRRA